MATVDRRRKLTIEQVNDYWRNLKEGVSGPELHTLCNAIRILDLALADSDAGICSRLSRDTWSRIRNDLFDILLSSFSGYFVIYMEGSQSPLEPGSSWPETGLLEFYPEMVKRRDDASTAFLQNIHHSLQLRLRWCFAEGRQFTTPDDFASFNQCSTQSDEEAVQAHELLNKLYEACADEANKLKKIAHRKWWQLQSEVMGCGNRRRKTELRREMAQLELIWGPTSSTPS